MTRPRWTPEKGPVLPWRIGQVAQGLVMGVLLVFALIGLFALAGNVAVFSYQGY